MIKHAIALSAVALLGGCAVYTPRNLPAMSTPEICYLEFIQGRNVSGAGRQAIQSELQRRNDNCRNHSGEVAQMFANFMYRESAGNQSP